MHIFAYLIIATYYDMTQ